MTFLNENPLSKFKQTYDFPVELQETYRQNTRDFCATLATLPKGSMVLYEWSTWQETAGTHEYLVSNPELLDGNPDVAYCSTMFITVNDRLMGLNLPSILKVFGISLSQMIRILQQGWFTIQARSGSSLR